MKMKFTFNYGPISAEFTGEDQEELQEELIEFLKFIEEKENIPSDFSASSANSISKNGEMKTSATGRENSTSMSKTGASELDDSGFISLSTKTDVDNSTLDQLFELPNDEEGTPRLNMYHFEDGTLTLGQYRNQRQAQASALLLYAWEECLNEKKINYDRLDEALVSSDIETERRDAMGQAFSDDAREWFESDGSSIYLVGKGKNHARELIQELAEKLDE